MNMNSPLGLIEYTRQSHPEFYVQMKREYANYNNWLSHDFLKLGHVYKRVSNTGMKKFFVLDGFKPILNEKSLKLTYTYIVHLSTYDSDDKGEWYTLDQLYKMLLEDVTDKYGVQAVPDDIPCDLCYRILSETDDELTIIKTVFSHRSYADYNYNKKQLFNRHYCDCEYIRYDYVLSDGEWTKNCCEYMNRIRLSADNTGWCHDTDVHGVSGDYDGYWNNLRDVKERFIGVKTLAHCKQLFDDINFLSTDMFTPYPIKENKW